jgi:hypothetical protein
MTAKKISQRDARRFRHRAEQLQKVLDDQRKAWISDFPGGIHVTTLYTTDDVLKMAIKTTRKLGHAVVVCDNGGQLEFYALPIASPQA